MNKMTRKEVKVHEETPGILISYDVNSQTLLNVNEDYTSKFFKKFKVENIIYDDHVISCYYSSNTHPMADKFNEAFIEVTKMYAQNRMTVILEGIYNGIATIVVFPTDKVKPFKEQSNK